MLSEELDRRWRLGDRSRVDRVRLGGQWRNLDHTLARDPQQGAAGDEDREARAGEEQVVQEGGGVEDLLEVVDDQEQARVAQRGFERLDRRAGSRFDHADGLSEGGRHRLGRHGCGDRRPGDLIVERRGARDRYVQGEPGFANPARADQGDEAGMVLRQQLRHGGDVAVSPNHGSERERRGNEAVPPTLEWDGLKWLNPLAVQSQCGAHWMLVRLTNEAARRASVYDHFGNQPPKPHCMNVTWGAPWAAPLPPSPGVAIYPAMFVP